MSNLSTPISQATSAGDGTPVQPQQTGQNTAIPEGGATSSAGNTGVITPSTGTNQTQQQQTLTPEMQTIFERLLDERMARERTQSEKRVAEARTKATEEAEATRLREQGDWQKLAERRDTENRDLRAQIELRDMEALRLRVSAKHRLPEGFHTRLIGSTESELDTDARKLAAELKPPAAPNFEGAKPRDPSTSQQTLDETERAKRRATGAYRI